MAEKDGERHQEQPPSPTSAFRAVLRVTLAPFIVTALCPKLGMGVRGARWSWSSGAAGERCGLWMGMGSGLEGSRVRRVPPEEGEKG